MRVPRGKCGNEGRPFQGIDTPYWQLPYSIDRFVEMKVAPFRALTLHVVKHGTVFHVVGGNEGRPFQGIDTHPEL